MATKAKPIFRLLVTGSRDWEDTERIWWALNRLDAKLASRPGVLVHGDARGVDRIAASHWLSLGNGALRLGSRTHEQHPVTPHDWQVRGPSAGMQRNQAMVRLGANLCLAFIRQESNGATMCANTAEKAGIKTLRFTA